MFTINQNLIDDFADKINEKEKKNNKVTSWSSTTTDAHYPSEKLVKDSLDSKASSSHTHGNLQNNGQVGSTAQANKNVVTDSSGKITTEDKPTIPSASSTTPSADTTNGSAGTGTTWARSNHTHPKSSLYAEANHTHSNYLTSHQDISGKEDKTNKVTSWSSTTTDTHYPSEKLVKDSLDGKQEELVSGTNLKTLNGVDLLGEGDIAIDVSCGEDSTIIFEEDGSVDNSSTLFGEHISLRNSGTGTATYNNNGYYVITNTKASAECFIEFPLLQGIYNKSFKVTVRSQGTTTYRCPIGLYYYLDDNNWGGVKDEIGDIWTSAKTNGVFTENSTAIGNSNNVEVVSEFIFDVDENTLTVNDYVDGVLKGTKSMTVPVTLTSSVKWGTTTTWDNNTSRNLYEIKAEYPCGGSTTLYNPKLDGTEPQITLDEDNVFTTGNGVAGGLNQVGYIGDGFDNSTDWELTLTLTTALWGGGLTILLNPYTIEDATCSNSDKWNCYFQNNNADLLQWLDGAIKINSGSNLSDIGISYTRGTTVNIKIVKEGTTFKYYENGTLKGSYTWAKLGTASKVYIGVMGWGGYAHSFTNVLAKSLYNQVVFNESSDNIIKLGDDIIDLIDNTLGHMISNWEDYE